MGTNDQDKGTVRRVIQQQVEIRSYGKDQRVEIPSSGNDLRKGVNVLPTSDPKHPDPNPFVEAQKQGATQGRQPNPSSNNAGKRSE